MFIIATMLPAFGVTVHCLFNIWQGKALEPYVLVIMDHPILTNLGATYFDILIGDLVVLISVILALYLRHRHYRDERDFLKKYNVKGKTGFFRNIKISSRDRDQSFDSDYDD